MKINKFVADPDVELSNSKEALRVSRIRGLPHMYEMLRLVEGRYLVQKELSTALIKL